MKRAAVSCLMVAFYAGSIFPQTANICGWVADPYGLPLTHTVVRLGQTTYDNGFGQSPHITTTDNYGRYNLGVGSACGCVGFTCGHNIIPKSTFTRGDAFSQPVCAGGKVLFSLPAGDALVSMGIYDLAGRFVRAVMNKNLSKGNYSVSIDTRGISSQVYLLRVTINGSASVIRLQPASRLWEGAVVRSAPEFQTRLEKLAAIVDTLHATEPGYTIGVMPITALTGQYNFTLTKNNTFNGDMAAFWGDTSTYPKTNGIQYVILNRTNGAFPDSQIFWSNQQNGKKVSLATQSTFQASFPGSSGSGGRFYVWVAPDDSGSRYFDFLEVLIGGTDLTHWWGNTSRVDGWRLPIAFRLHTSTGIDTTMGDAYEMFCQSRQAKFDEFKNEVPKEFTGLAIHDFANIWAPHTSPVNYFNTGGQYVNYFDKYEDSVLAHNPGSGKVNAWNIFACAGGGMGSSPAYSSAVNRHCGTLPQSAWLNDTNYYKAPPCNYFSYWCHRRSINNYCYGFSYDDFGGHEAFMDKNNVQWIAIAIGW